MTEKDKENIGALITDPKYISFVKLMANLKAQWIQKVIHRKVDEEGEMINRGGVMMLQALEKAVENQFLQRYQDMADAQAKEEVLDGLGW